MAVQFFEDVLKRIEILMSDVKMMKAKLFDKNINIKPWKAKGEALISLAYLL